MSGLGDLVVNLSANTQKFDKNISKSQGGLKSFASSAMSLLNPVTATLATMTAGAVGLGAAVWGLQGRIGTLAAVADKAAQTGLSGAFLQQLEFAADQSGVSAETLTGGIKKLTVMIGKAGDGSKEASSALQSVGLNLKELQQLSPEQQFEQVAAAIGRIPTAAGRASAAVKIFGKSGIEMTGLFAGGLDDITKLMQDARDIGIGLDEKQLAAIAEADDSLQKMYASISAMVDQVAVGLAPAFEAVSESITGMIGPTTKLFDTFNNLDDRWTWAGDTIVAAFDVAMETIKVHWKEMLEDMLTAASDFSWDAHNFAMDIMNPVGMAQRGLEVANDAGAQAGIGNVNGLEAAQDRLAALIGKFDGAADANKAQDATPKEKEADTKLKAKEAQQQAFNSGIASLIEGVKESAATGVLGQIGMAAGGMVDRAKIQAAATGNMLSNWLGSPLEKQKTLEPRLAGAMQGGSVEAYSTLVQSMLTRGKDPVVAATEKQTRDLIKGLRPKKESKNIESFVMQ